MIKEGSHFWAFVDCHIHDDPQKLRLASHGKKYDFDVALAIMQVEARQRFGRKHAATLDAYSHFLFPSLLSGEQSTSDALSEYHAALTGGNCTIADLTAGLGIDALHFTRNAIHVTAVERSPQLADALTHNAKGMDISNLDVICGDCRALIDRWSAQGRQFDVAFIDPARRAADGHRIYSLEDSEPDVTSLLISLSKICGRLIVKASPMLDVNAALHTLKRIPNEVKAIGTLTECKELLFIFNFKHVEQPNSPQLEAITLHADGIYNAYAFTMDEERRTEQPKRSSEIKPGDTVYRLYPSVMKLGPYKLIVSEFGLCSFDINTKIFFSHKNIQKFPGLRYDVESVLPYSSGVIKKFARNYPIAEVTALNFGDTAAEVKSKLKVRDGKDAVHIFAVPDATKHRILIVTRQCEKK